MMYAGLSGQVPLELGNLNHLEKLFLLFSLLFLFFWAYFFLLDSVQMPSEELLGIGFVKV